MTITPCSEQESLPQTLEECDERFLNGVLLIKDAVLGYAKCGLNGVQISKRVKELGGKLSERTAQEYLKHFREAGLLPEAAASRTTLWRQKRAVSERETCALKQEPTEAPIDVEVLPPKQEDPMNFVTIDNWLEPEQPTTATTNNVRRPNPELDERLLRDDPLWGNTDAEHWQHTQECDEPASYKQAQEYLTHFKRLLYRGGRDGWSEQAYAALRDDLEEYAGTCAACSEFRRERNHEAVEERWASLQGAIQRGEGGSGTPCLPGS